MSIVKLRSLGMKLRYFRDFASSLSSRRTFSSTPFSPVLKQSSSIANPFPSHLRPLLPQGSFIFRLYSARHFEDRDRSLDYAQYERRSAINWGVRIVPHQEACVIERFGKFHKVLGSGLHFLIPFIDTVAYIHSLKEEVIRIPNQNAVTTDNVTLQIDGVLFVKIVDPVKASYSVEYPILAVIQLAQALMRAAIGEMTLDETFKERKNLNAKIMDSIQEATTTWGLMCHRYDILDIIPPPGVRATMERPAEAERMRRATIVEADGKREAVILASEAAKTDQINKAQGKADAIRLEAMANAEAINALAKALQGLGGKEAANLKVAQQYVQAFSNLAKESTTLLLPSSVSDPSSMVTQALTLYKRLLTVSDKASQDLEKPLLDEAVREDAFMKDIKVADASATGEFVTDMHEKPSFSLQSARKEE